MIEIEEKSVDYTLNEDEKRGSVGQHRGDHNVMEKRRKKEKTL